MAKPKTKERSDIKATLLKNLKRGKSQRRGPPCLTIGELVDPPPLRPIKWRVAIAHQKHAHDLDSPAPPRPTLGDRFHALPGELREIIFSFLIVRPAKWDLQHKPDCALTLCTYVRPPYLDRIRETCVECQGRHTSGNRGTGSWRSNDRLPVWVNPWRSQWAPEQMNPYLCTSCYDARYRAKPLPQAKSLPCLCARREDLAVLLVCKQWYSEAGRAFYGRNTFAFEDSSTFVNFFSMLDPRWRAKVSHVSFLTSLPSGEIRNPIPVAVNNETDRQLAPVWSLLRKLPSLAHLELDVLFLTRVKTVQAMQRLGLRNLRKLYFTERRPASQTTRPSIYIWPEISQRLLVQAPFVTTVAHQIEGVHRFRPKQKELEELVEAEVEAQNEPVLEVMNMPIDYLWKATGFYDMMAEYFTLDREEIEYDSDDGMTGFMLWD